MQAIRVNVYGEPEVMVLEERPEPRPGKGELVVEVRAAGVNPVDTYIRSGTYPGGGEPPYTPGFDGAGIVTAVGPEVGHFRAGDRVYLSNSLTGTYAQLALCREDQVHPLPEGVSFTQGAALGIPYATAWHALFHRGAGRPGDFLLVHGASGGVGLAAVQIARAAGLHVLGTAGSDQGCELVKAQGAHAVLDHHRENHLEEIPRLTCNQGVDLVLEMLADANLDQDLEALADGGRVVVIGCRGKVEINPREAMAREAAILGMVIFKASAAEQREIHAALLAGLENGTLDPVIDREMPLADAPEAHRRILEGPAKGKIVLIPRQPSE